MKDQTRLFHYDPLRSAQILPPGERIMVFSDLHVGDRYKDERSGYSDKEITTILEQAMHQCDRLVLNGDIVELLNSRYSDSNTAQEGALTFLSGLCAKAKMADCSIEFLFGNHEYQVSYDPSRVDLLNREAVTAALRGGNGTSAAAHHIPENFVRGLVALEEHYPGNFRWHPVAYRFGSEKESVLAWHGDRHTHNHHQRRISSRPQTVGSMDRALNIYADHSRFSRLRTQLEILLNAKSEKAAEMLDAVQDENGQTILGKVTRICFGHTHDAFVGAGLDFNTYTEKAPQGMSGKTYADRLHLKYDNPGTAQEGRELCFPVLYTLKEDGRIKTEQYRVRMQGEECAMEAVDPARTRARRWQPGR